MTLVSIRSEKTWTVCRRTDPEVTGVGRRDRDRHRCEVETGKGVGSGPRVYGWSGPLRTEVETVLKNRRSHEDKRGQWTRGLRVVVGRRRGPVRLVHRVP